jgi:hypothetical protein
LRWIHALIAIFLLSSAVAGAASRVVGVSVPGEMRSTAFTAKINGHAVDVAHAAASLEYAAFDGAGPVTLEVTATEPGFWDKGVEVEPWRLGLRAERHGQTIRLKLDGPQKLSIERPGDFLNHATMLFVFYGSKPKPAPKGANVRVIKPGVYRQSLNPKSGETIYLEPGATVFGSLNLWRVEHVRVLGRGTIVYEGGQDPNNDDGWQQRPDWHCIGAMEAKDVKIEGLTCVVRARTWSIQMKDSFGFAYRDLRVIGGNPGNANQDGMDWLGGGEATVTDSFLRASDDVFAMQGNWDGYRDADFLRPGKDVRKISIDHSVLSTSISNIVRAAWPRKTFNSSEFTLRDSDILHGGIGACGQTFGVLGFWGANGAKGQTTGYRFENLFLDHWYSLAQIEQEQPGARDFVFRNIWALDQPPLAGSTVLGQVQGVRLENVKLGQKRAEGNADVPLVVGEGTEPVTFAPGAGPVARFRVSPPSFGVGETVRFEAVAAPGAKYTWFFGDGTQATGRTASHRYKDAEGTELDAGGRGAGRFRAMLRVEDRKGRVDWAAQGVVVVGRWRSPVVTPANLTTGLSWKIYGTTATLLPDLRTARVDQSGESAGLSAEAGGYTRYAAAWDGFLEVPADGGYTFHLMARDGARVVIDGVEVAQTGAPFAQVCGSPGNAMRYDRGALGLRAGKHTLHVEALHQNSPEWPKLMWEGPGLPLIEVPQAVFTHPRRDGMRGRQ